MNYPRGPGGGGGGVNLLVLYMYTLHVKVLYYTVLESPIGAYNKHREVSSLSGGLRPVGI